MINKLLCFFILLPLALHAQTPPISVNDFSGGLNTSSNWNRIATNQAFQVRNFLLDSEDGSLTVRPGYRAVASAFTANRIWSLNSHKFLNGDGYFFQIYEVNTNVGEITVQESKLFVSSANRTNRSDNLYNWIYPKPGHWVNWNGRQYFFNGRQPAIIVDGGPENFRAEEMLPPAPGQAVAVPMGGVGVLDGEYIYAIVAENVGSGVARTGEPSTRLSKRWGVESRPVLLNLEKARITGFMGQIKDSSTAQLGDSDTLWFFILRTIANQVDKDLDNFHVVDSILRPNGSTDTIAYFDNKPRDTILPNFYRRIRQIDGGSVVPEWSMIRGNDTAYAMGAMSYITADTGGNFDTTIGTKALTGVSADHLYNLYCYTFMDKYTGVESDTSRILAVPKVALITSDLTLGVPLPPSDRYYRILYRAHVAEKHNAEPNSPKEFTGWQNQIFYILDTMKSDTSTEYWDTLGVAQLELNNEDYDRQMPEALLNGAIIHEGQMYAWDDFTVYQSLPDTTAFPFYTNGTFDLDDGDKIIGLASFEGYVVVYKSNSVWILFTSAGTVRDRRKATKGIGMVAEYSIDQYGGDNIYLGPRGVFRESDSRRRDNKALRDPISDPIKNILLRSNENMKDAHGVVLNDYWLLSYPGTDSTFVYFFKTGGWSIFDFDFSSAVLYDTINGGNATMNFRTLYFVKDDNTAIYAFDLGDSTDAGADFEAVYEKRYLANSPFTMSFLDQIVIQNNANTEAGDSLTLSFATEEGDSIGTWKMGLDKRYRKQRILATNNRVFHHLNFKITAPNRPGIVIQGYNIVTGSAGQD